MKDQVVIQQLLQKKFSEMQSTNARYSLRAFSKKIGLNPGALSGILNGKRNVSVKIVERIAERLSLDPQERSELFSHFRILRYQQGSETHENAEYRQITAAQFKVTAEWEHFAILSLIRTKGFKSESEWIARRLGITVTKARDSVKRLMEAGMVGLNANGKLIRTSPKFRTTDDIANISLRRSHEQSLELAAHSLVRDQVKDRDHTWLMLAMNPKKLSIAKEKIRRFQDELADLVETGEQTEVYRLSMHLFPLSNPETGKTEENENNEES